MDLIEINHGDRCADIGVAAPLTVSAVTNAAGKVTDAFREANLTRKEEKTIVKAATTLRVLEGNESLC